MRNLTRQFDVQAGPKMTGSIVVSAQMKIILNRSCYGVGNRDGPLIFHMRDGPPNVTGPPGGTGPPEDFSSATGPPKTTGPPMEWLGRKKMLKRT